MGFVLAPLSSTLFIATQAAGTVCHGVDEKVNATSFREAAERPNVSLWLASLVNDENSDFCAVGSFFRAQL
jgi:hypothetical protein